METTPTISARPTSSAPDTGPTDHPIRRLAAIGAVGAAVATAANAIVFGVGRAAGLEFIISTSTADGIQQIGIGDVVSLTVVSFALGLAAAVVGTRWGHPRLRTLQYVGAGLAILSTWGDFGLESTAAAKATLITMHLMVGAVYVLTLEVARRANRPID